MSMTAGGIIAKAKSMYANQLSKEEYEELMRRNTVAEIAGYLKKNTHFAEALKDVRENNIHRGQLENMLRRDMFAQAIRLYHYADATQKKYYQLYMQQLEVDLILSRIRVLISQNYEDAIAEFPVFLKAYTSFDMIRLGSVHTFHELLEVLKDTIYYETILPFRVGKNEEALIDYTSIETALEKQYYANTFRIIKMTLKGLEASTVRAFFIAKTQLENIAKVYRYKKFFNAREDVIRNALIVVPGDASNELMEILIAEKSAEGVLKRLKHTKYAIEVSPEGYIEDATNRLIYDLAKRYFYQAQGGAVVFMSYLVLLSGELTNIINIIEGIRYQVNAEDIQKMLLY